MATPWKTGRPIDQLAVSRKIKAEAQKTKPRVDGAELDWPKRQLGIGRSSSTKCKVLQLQAVCRTRIIDDNTTQDNEGILHTHSPGKDTIWRRIIQLMPDPADPYGSAAL